MAEQVYSGSWSQNGVWQLCQGVWAAQWQGRNRDDSIPFISKSPAYVPETSTVIIQQKKKKGGWGRIPAWHSVGDDKWFSETLVKMEQRNKNQKKKEQRTGQMADQSMYEPDAEQARQEMLALCSKNTNINNPNSHSYLFFLYPFHFLFVNCSTRDRCITNPLCNLPADPK